MAVGDRLYLVHLASGDTVSAQFNPTELREKLKVIWRNVEVHGESHESMEYDHTGNLETKFDLAFDSESGQGIDLGGDLVRKPSQVGSQGTATATFFEDTQAEIVRRWLFACCYPMRNGEDLRPGAPSRLLVVWPNFYSLAMRLTGVEIITNQWRSTDGPPVMFSAALEFHFDPQTRLYYEDVLEQGTEMSDGV